MKYSYFVSYVYCEGWKTTYANCNMTSEKKLDSYEAIYKLAKTIADSENLEHTPTILFYKLLGKVGR